MSGEAGVDRRNDEHLRWEIIQVLYSSAVYVKREDVLTDAAVYYEAVTGRPWTRSKKES